MVLGVLTHPDPKTVLWWSCKASWSKKWKLPSPVVSPGALWHTHPSPGTARHGPNQRPAPRAGRNSRLEFLQPSIKTFPVMACSLTRLTKSSTQTGSVSATSVSGTLVKFRSDHRVHPKSPEALGRPPKATGTPPPPATPSVHSTQPVRGTNAWRRRGASSCNVALEGSNRFLGSNLTISVNPKHFSPPVAVVF